MYLLRRFERFSVRTGSIARMRPGPMSRRVIFRTNISIPSSTAGMVEEGKMAPVQPESLGLRYDDPDSPLFFPRHIVDLDIIPNRVLTAGAELESDHPGFHDLEYRARRRNIARSAELYCFGQPLPSIEYTNEENQVWGIVYDHLTTLYPTHAADEFNRVFPLLQFKRNEIPQLGEINNRLYELTRFRLRPVAGLLTPRDFLNSLAFRVFNSTQYIRHHSVPLYTPEPDIVHEFLGHVPLFAHPELAQFSQELGLASLGVSDDDITRLARNYWFTMEFGLIKEESGKLKAFGAGLCSSFGELEYCLSGTPEIRPYDPWAVADQDFPITKYQPVYYVVESFEDMIRQLKEFALTLDRPFDVSFDESNESIHVYPKRNVKK